MSEPGILQKRDKEPVLLVTTHYDSVKLLLEGRCHDPFRLLGRHWLDKHFWVVRALVPNTESIHIQGREGQLIAMQRLGNTDLFEVTEDAAIDRHYRFLRVDAEGNTHSWIDPYSFEPQLSDLDLYLFNEGMHYQIYQRLGANHSVVDGIKGVLFATWAPNAERVSLIGDFNGWNGLATPMRCRGRSGIWEIFIPGMPAGERYKFEIRGRHQDRVITKADPYARVAELRPATASRVDNSAGYNWQDTLWMSRRRHWDWQHEPLSIYEVHPASWRKPKTGNYLNWRELAHQLVSYVSDLGFTHIELMPIAEHPFDGSWGYQCTGYYAPSSRFGTPDDFRYFVDYCHGSGIGVLIDWVASHFPKDECGLVQFDGSALYEYQDPRKAEHLDWGTLVFNYGRHEVKNFLLANALYWLKEFHIDGLRVDAVASMLYLDYSRNEGEWVPNEYGGNEHLEAINFLRELNQQVHSQFPGALVIAEESTAWPQVSRPTYTGGLGFSMKWNMGWMNDTLDYFSQDPIYRRYHHQQLTFSMLYAYHENFVLALSHDEVVHGKKSLLEKMPGDDWQKFANLRLLYTYMYTWPGKKLLFMGGEFGQRSEWNADGYLGWGWGLHYYSPHRGIRDLVVDLNRLYQNNAALHRHDFEPCGFEWIDCSDTNQSVVSYLRQSGNHLVVVALNFTPVPRYQYRLGVPRAGNYREVLNSDSRFYGGSDLGNGGIVSTRPGTWMNKPHSIELTLPPLGGIILAWTTPEDNQAFCSSVIEAANE